MRKTNFITYCLFGFLQCHHVMHCLLYELPTHAFQMNLLLLCSHPMVAQPTSTTAVPLSNICGIIDNDLCWGHGPIVLRDNKEKKRRCEQHKWDWKDLPDLTDLPPSPPPQHKQYQGSIVAPICIKF